MTTHHHDLSSRRCRSRSTATAAIRTGTPTGWTPGPTASDCFRGSTRLSSAPECSPATRCSGRRSERTRQPSRSGWDATRTRGRSSTRASRPKPRTWCSRALSGATWPTARIVRDLDELRAFKAQPGGPVYVVGGIGLVRSLIDDGLLDELRLIVHPVALGAGAALFDGITRRPDLELVDSERATAGRINLTYRVTPRVRPCPAEITDNVIAEFRANDGHVGGDLADTPIILIHHVGARTRIERVTPLAYRSLPDGRLVIAASNGGSPDAPRLVPQPQGTPDDRGRTRHRTFTAVAEELTGAAYAELWPKLVAASPALGEFQAKTARRIPLFVLTPGETGRGEDSAPHPAPCSTPVCPATLSREETSTYNRTTSRPDHKSGSALSKDALGAAPHPCWT